MLTLIPLLFPSRVFTNWHAEGALSRRHPGEARHGSGKIVPSLNRSSRTDVSSTPQLPPPPWCFIPLPGATGETDGFKRPSQLLAAQHGATGPVVFTGV